MTGEQRRIGITGGIASGKSSIGRFLQEVKGLPVLDADIFAKEVLQPGKYCTNEVIKKYGPAVVKQNCAMESRIDRKALAKIIFNHSSERQWLETLMHPLIKRRFKTELCKIKNEPIIIIMAPLLFEAKINRLCTETWLVKCSGGEQIKRLIKRDKLTRSEAKLRINAQWSIEKKEKLANYIIDNDQGLDESIKKVEKLLSN